MPRYIDIENLNLKGIAVFDENLDVLIPLSDVRKALQMTPTADVAPRAEIAREIFLEILALCDNAEDKFDKLFTKVDEYRKGYENSVKHFKENMIKLQEKYTGEQNDAH